MIFPNIETLHSTISILWILWVSALGYGFNSVMVLRRLAKAPTWPMHELELSLWGFRVLGFRA